MFLEELKEFIRNFLIWIYFLLGSSFFFFFFGLKNIELLGKNWLYWRRLIILWPSKF